MEIGTLMPWILIGLGIIVGLNSLRKKAFRKRMRSLFKWPPQP